MTGIGPIGYRKELINYGNTVVHEFCKRCGEWNPAYK